MFNDYMWQTYLNAGGKDVVEKFRKNLTDEYTIDYADMIKKLYISYCPTKHIVDSTYSFLANMVKCIEDGDFPSGCISIIDMPEGDYDLREYLQVLYDGINYDGSYNASSVFKEFSYCISFYSTFLHFYSPDFVPYYFECNFNVLARITEAFDIELPDFPAKRDYEKRFYYYGDICVVLNRFREEHNMSPYELCAFLYDFAPKYIGGIDSYIIKDLPNPQCAFFIGADKDDEFLVDEDDIITPWQCNPNAKAGDIAVMYLRTPISSVDSQWRCVSDGFIDPFFYYYRCAYIANPLKIKRTTQKELEQDEIFKDLSIVKKNMQGINGVELLPSQYNHLMDMSKADVPRLEYTVTQTGIELMSENDVKDKLIKPLINKLGYTDSEYKAELHLEIGNHNNMIIPDFVILPDETTGQQSAFTIIEAKYDIKNKVEFESVMIQARSYARQCIAKYSAIIDRSKLWIYTPQDDYTNAVFSATWDELNNADIFSELFKLIGKRKRK